MICKGPFAAYHNAANEFERKTDFQCIKKFPCITWRMLKKKSNNMIWLLSISTKE